MDAAVAEYDFSMRVIGSWKNRLNHTQAVALAREIAAWPASAIDGLDVTLMPPMISLPDIRAVLPRTSSVGCQNVVWDAPNAFTGETSVAAAAEAGASIVMIGHSERRTFLGETNQQVALKVASVFAAGLTPLICVGETFEERQAAMTRQVIASQLRALYPMLAEHADGVLVAYEPAWAITTNAQSLPADPAIAAMDHAWLRSHLVEEVGDAARSVPLIYGAGVNEGNAGVFAATDDVDGVLVGGASQQSDTFLRLLESVSANGGER